MSARRLKAAALPVPVSRAAADELLGQIGRLQRQLDVIDAALTEEVAAAKARAAAEAKPVAEQIKTAFQALTIWAERNREELCRDGRKSVTLSQGVIGWRIGLPTVRIAKGMEDELVSIFGRLGKGHLIRTRQEVDKEAVLRDPNEVAGIPGIAVEQTESFFAKPLDLEAEQVKTTGKLKVARRGASDVTG